MKIVVTGAAGMLGLEMVRFLSSDHHVTAVVRNTRLPSDVSPATVVEWDIEERAPEQLRQGVDLWIHCAAFTSVDGAEKDPRRAHRTNVEGTRSVVDLAATTGAKLLYISTDSVFDGVRGLYTEGDPVAPLNAYARTKVAAEEVVTAYSGGLVVRTNLVSSDSGLVSWIIETARSGRALTLFRDVVFNPVPVWDLPALAMDLVESDASGIVHLGSVEILTKAQFGRLILARTNLQPLALREVPLAEAGLTAARPLNTSLCTLHARRLGLRMPSLDSLFDRMEPEEHHDEH